MVVKDSLALLIGEERGTLLVGVERRLDTQLVVLKHTESISELEFFQRLTLNCNKCMFCLGFFVRTFSYEHSPKYTGASTLRT